MYVRSTTLARDENAAITYLDFVERAGVGAWIP
jgi:hypothetical protein